MLIGSGLSYRSLWGGRALISWGRSVVGGGNQAAQVLMAYSVPSLVAGSRQVGCVPSLAGQQCLRSGSSHGAILASSLAVA